MNNVELKLQDFSSGLPIQVIRRDPQPVYPLHCHDFAELVIVYGGSGVHFTEQFEQRLKPGDAFIVDHHYYHGYRDINGLQLINIIYSPDSLPLMMIDPQTMPVFKALFFVEPNYRRTHGLSQHLQLNPSQLKEAMFLVENMETVIGQSDVGTNVIIAGLFLQLIGYLAQCYADNIPVVFRPYVDVGKVIKFLEKRFPDSVKVKEMAAVASMTERTLSRHFKEATGYAPLEYYQHLCINKACQMLKNSGQSISEIAFACGFSDSNYFSRQFKKIIGVSPKDYRSENLVRDQ